MHVDQYVVKKNPTKTTIRRLAVMLGLTGRETSQPTLQKQLATANEIHQKTAVEWLEEATAVINDFGGKAMKNTKGSSLVTLGCMASKSLIEAMHKTNKFLRDNIGLLGTTSFTSGYICLDAETKDVHAEEDTTMTMTCVPMQDFLAIDDDSPASFNFYLNDSDGTVLKMPLGVGMAVFFNGFFVSHRQERTSKETLVNVSAYGNRQLYNAAKKTQQRNMHAKVRKMLD